MGPLPALPSNGNVIFRTASTKLNPKPDPISNSKPRTMVDKVTVTVKEGKVRGFKTKTAYSGAEYYTFFGVPYGQSTAGKARFKDPVKAKSWNGVLDGTVPKHGCLQFNMIKKTITGTEDCLYNNIHTPKLPSKGEALRAVIVNIHPGGFVHGAPDPDYYGAPDYVMHRDIVYVCVGHRLHLIGYLNLHMKTCSGNQGLKDVILSLKWIQENISVFGGDPNNVTVMGSSSGSAIVHHLMLTPLATRLYHKAILMGMYVFSPVLVTRLDNKPVAYEVAKMLDYEGLPQEDKKLLNFYKNLKFEHLFRARPEQFFNNTTLQVYPASPFLPTPEPGEDSPMPEAPNKLIPSTNRVPVMIGFCEREGSMALGILRTLKKSISDSFTTAIRQNAWGWGANLNEMQLKLVQKEVERFYLAGEPIETAEQSILCDIITDAALSDVYDSLINVVSADLPSSVFVYNFLYDGKFDYMKLKTARLLGKELKGPFHAADYGYWCYNKEAAGKTMANIQPKERHMIDTFTNLVTTFAKTSNPNYEGIEAEWKPTTPENPTHFVIDETLECRDGLWNGKRMQVWHDLKRKIKKENEYI